MNEQSFIISYMRMIDESKKVRITESVYRIVRENGISGLSFGKIAKMANVSPGTPYVYYSDKTDMLSKIFLEAKSLLDEGIEEDIASASTTREKIFQCVYHFVKRFHEFPNASVYLRTMYNCYSLLDQETAKEAERMSEPIFTVYHRAVDEGLWRDNTLKVIIPLLYGPVFMAIDTRNNAGEEWTPQEMEPIVRMSMTAALI